MEYVTLNNGVKMPQLGYGVYQVTNEECERCVLDAILSLIHIVSEDTGEQEISEWARGLELSDDALVPESGDGNTVATAKVTPDTRQVLYLWEEGNAPAITEYTVNDGGYFDNPDFRPYLTSFPVPEGVKAKGAVFICPGGAFQFRSDQPEGVDVAEALSKLGYQSFVVAVSYTHLDVYKRQGATPFPSACCTLSNPLLRWSNSCKRWKKR